jgi:diadenosine tetraphosphate (Ap4A) HIT family hydrolase
MHEREPIDLGLLSAAARSGRCFICEFLKGNPDFAHHEVARTASAVAFLNKYPTLFGYVLVAPLAHIEQVTGGFDEAAYLEMQRFIYRVAEGVRRILAPERLYVLSLGSQALNSHVHWHIAALPPGVPPEEQQFRALMHERGTIRVNDGEMRDFAARLGMELA